MVQGLTVRALAVVAALAVAALIALSAGEGGKSAGLLAEIGVSSTRQSLVQSTVADLPDVAIETADGGHTSFAATGGHVRIVTMVYAHCPGVCPLTIESLRGIDRQLSARQQARLGFVLVSLDPSRDSPEALRALARQHGLSSPRWVVGRTSEPDAHAFAAAVQVRYRGLSDGSIDHSSALVLVDGRGRVLARSRDADAEEFVAAVGQALDRE